MNEYKFRGMEKFLWCVPFVSAHFSFQSFSSIWDGKRHEKTLLISLRNLLFVINFYSLEYLLNQPLWKHLRVAKNERKRWIYRNLLKSKGEENDTKCLATNFYWFQHKFYEWFLIQFGHKTNRMFQGAPFNLTSPSLSRFT